jgi:hypothetical protein
MNKPVVSPTAPSPEVAEGIPLAHRHSAARAAEALEEIETYLTLDSDWDLEGARPIDREAAALAAQIVRLVEESAGKQGVSWQTPVVGPDPDGGIDLVWRSDDRQALIMARPDHSQSVECVTKEAGGPPLRQTVSVADAIRFALWALGSA